MSGFHTFEINIYKEIERNEHFFFILLFSNRKIDRIFVKKIPLNPFVTFILKKKKIRNFLSFCQLIGFSDKTSNQHFGTPITLALHHPTPTCINGLLSLSLSFSLSFQHVKKVVGIRTKSKRQAASGKDLKWERDTFGGIIQTNHNYYCPHLILHFCITCKLILELKDQPNFLLKIVVVVIIDVFVIFTGGPFFFSLTGGAFLAFPSFQRFDSIGPI